MSGIDLTDMENRLNICISALDAWYFGDETAFGILKNHFKVHSLEGLGLNDFPAAALRQAPC